MSQMVKTGRITFDDETFQRLIDGEALHFSIRPETTTIVVSLDPRSKHHARFQEIMREVRKESLISLPGRLLT